MTDLHLERSLLLADSVIKKLNLNLTGLNVLTECGSGIFAISPAIAALAGASKVYAWTRDSQYGTGQDNARQCAQFLNSFGIEEGRVEFAINTRPAEHISQADIITNLGFVRPLNREFLSHAKEGAALPIMCEAWEFRHEDIDLELCKKKNIKIAGTWENHPDLLIFDGCGYLAAKLCFEAGFEIYQNKICIWSDDDFGIVIRKAIEKFSPEKVTLTTNPDDLKGCDILIIADYLGHDLIVGENALIPEENLINVGVVHLCGALNIEFCHQKNIKTYPNQPGHYHRMTRTLAHLGIKPMIDLHTAGLKVGELLIKNQTSELVQKI